MRAVAAILALAIPSAANAQAQPYKLAVASSDGGVAVTEYPSLARCERAKEAIAAEARRRIAASVSDLPPGSIQVKGPRIFDAICIPG